MSEVRLEWGAAQWRRRKAQERLRAVQDESRRGFHGVWRPSAPPVALALQRLLLVLHGGGRDVTGGAVGRGREGVVVESATLSLVRAGDALERRAPWDPVDEGLVAERRSVGGGGWGGKAAISRKLAISRKSAISRKLATSRTLGGGDGSVPVVTEGVGVGARSALDAYLRLCRANRAVVCGGMVRALRKGECALRLERQGLKPWFQATICPAIRLAGHLETLHVGGNALGSDDICALSAALLSSDAPIAEFSIEDTPLDHAAAAALALCVRRCKRASLSGCSGLDGVGVEILATALCDDFSTPTTPTPHHTTPSSPHPSSSASPGDREMEASARLAAAVARALASRPSTPPAALQALWERVHDAVVRAGDRKFPRPALGSGVSDAGGWDGGGFGGGGAGGGGGGARKGDLGPEEAARAAATAVGAAPTAVLGVLARPPCLQALDLSRCDLSAASAVPLARMAACGPLQELELSFNRLGPLGGIAIATSLLLPVQTAAVFDAQALHVRSSSAERGAQDPGEAAKAAGRTLQQRSEGTVRLLPTLSSPRGVAVQALAAPASTPTSPFQHLTLTALHAASSGVGDVAGAVLAASLTPPGGVADDSASAPLRKITEEAAATPAWASLAPAGAVGWLARRCTALRPAWASLTLLDLSACELAPLAGLWMAQMLRQNRAILSLRLGFNPIGFQAAMAIVRALLKPLPQDDIDMADGSHPPPPRGDNERLIELRLENVAVLPPPSQAPSDSGASARGKGRGAGGGVGGGGGMGARRGGRALRETKSKDAHKLQAALAGAMRGASWGDAPLMAAPVAPPTTRPARLPRRGGRGRTRARKPAPPSSRPTTAASRPGTSASARGEAKEARGAVDAGGEERAQQLWEAAREASMGRSRPCHVIVEWPPKFRAWRGVGRRGVDGAGGGGRGGPWSLEKSVFAPRVREADARAFFDTPRLLARAFEADWARAKMDRALRDARARAKVRSLLRPRYGLLREVFRFHALGQGLDPWTMGLNEFTAFRRDAGIEAADREQEFDLAFLQATVAPGLGRGGGAAAGEAGAGKALRRHEFLEAVVRCALVLYPPGVTTAASENAGGGSFRGVPATEVEATVMSVEAIMTHHIEPKAAEQLGLLDEEGHPLPSARLRDAWSNDFRRTRLYTEPVDLVLRAFLKPLHALYDRFSGAIGASSSSRGDTDHLRFLHLEGWVRLVNNAGLINAGATPDERGDTPSHPTRGAASSSSSSSASSTLDSDLRAMGAEAVDDLDDFDDEEDDEEGREGKREDALGAVAQLGGHQVAEAAGFSDRAARALFVFSIPTCVDEVERPPALARRSIPTALTFTAFLEAVGRLADSDACPGWLPLPFRKPKDGKEKEKDGKEKEKEGKEGRERGGSGAGEEEEGVEHGGMTLGPGLEGHKSYVIRRQQSMRAREIFGGPQSEKPEPVIEPAPPEELPSRLVLTIASLCFGNGVGLRGVPLHVPPQLDRLALNP